MQFYKSLTRRAEGTNLPFPSRTIKMAVLGQLGLYYSQADMQDKYIHKLQLASIALTPSIPQVHEEV